MPGILHQIEDCLSRLDISKAQILILRAMDERPTEIIRAQLLVYRATAYLLSKHPESCLQDLEAVRDIDSGFFATDEIQEIHADCLLLRFEESSTGTSNQDDLNSAICIYQGIITETPEYDNLGWIYYQLGNAFLALNRVREAIESLQQGLNGLSRKTTLKALCYERLGYIEFFIRREFKRSLDLLELAVAVYPPEGDKGWLASIHMFSARVLHALGRTEAMVYSVGTATKIASECSTNSTVLAASLLSAGELLSAVDWYEREAVDYLHQYLASRAKPAQIDVTWSRVHEIIGDLHFRLANYEAAAQAYSTALKFNPFHPWETSIYYRAAQCHYQLGAYRDVVTIIRRLLESAQSDSSPITDYRVYDILANAEFALARYDEAAEHYQKALDIAPPSFDGIEKIRLYHHFACQLLDNPQ